jgi:hypothetical protein
LGLEKVEIGFDLLSGKQAAINDERRPTNKMNMNRSYKDVASTWTPARPSIPIQTIVVTVRIVTNPAPPASYEHTSEHHSFDNPCRNPNRSGKPARDRNLKSRTYERNKRKWDRQNLRLPPVEDERVAVVEEPTVEEPVVIADARDFLTDEEWRALAEEEERRYEAYERYRDYRYNRWDW